jgi:hypothetical protein
MARLILPRDKEVIVASFGGVGTSFLMSFIARFKKINDADDKDHYKHSPLPPVSFNPNIKFIYVYGDPKLAVISLFRRGFHRKQARKLQWGTSFAQAVPQDMTLQEYADQGVDCFLLKEHFWNWYDRFLTHETMFVRYERLFDNREALLNFLDIPASEIESFPKKKERASKESEIPPDVSRKLEDIYGDFRDDLAQLEDIEVRKRHSPIFLIKKCLREPYRSDLISAAKSSLRRYGRKPL